jgi:transcriptional regulator with XRE-family HTH domain
MKTTLLEQIRERRLALGVKIQDMTLRAGLTRQQYGKIEAGGNPRLNTLDQIAEGLDAALVLVPKSKLEMVKRMLSGEIAGDHRYPDLDRRPDLQDLNIVKDADSPWGDL